MAAVFHPVQSDQALALQDPLRHPRPPPLHRLGRHLRSCHHRLRLAAETHDQDRRSVFRRDQEGRFISHCNSGDLMIPSQVWVSALGATVEPLCGAVGAVFANCRTNSLVQSA